VPLLLVLFIVVLLSLIYYATSKAPVALTELKPKLIELPEFKVTGLQLYGNFAKGEYPQAWAKVSNDKHEINADCAGGFSYGVELYKKEIQTEWHYLVGCEMLSPSNLAQERGIELATRVIPANLYAVFPYHGELTMKRAGALYSYIFNEWLPNNGYRHAGYYNFERYDKRFLGAQDSGTEFELFVPIVKVSTQ